MDSAVDLSVDESESWQGLFDDRVEFNWQGQPTTGSNSFDPPSDRYGPLEIQMESGLQGFLYRQEFTVMSRQGL